MNILEKKLELIHGLETEFLKILFYNFENDCSKIMKSYENNRLCIILEGERDIVFNKKPYRCDANNFIIVSSHNRDEIKVERGTKLLVIEFTDSLINLVKNKTSINLNIKDKYAQEENIFSRTDYEVSTSIDKIIEIAISDNRNKEFLLDLNSQELMYKLLHIAGVNRILTEQGNNPINKAIEIMKNNILDKITIGDIANNLNMPITKFSSKFKAVTGITPNNYLRKLKLLEAKEMLKYKTVTEVSYDLGYENISHFIELFKKSYGVTPKQYVLKNDDL